MTNSAQWVHLKAFFYTWMEQNGQKEGGRKGKKENQNRYSHKQSKVSSWDKVILKDETKIPPESGSINLQNNTRDKQVNWTD